MSTGRRIGIVAVAVAAAMGMSAVVAPAAGAATTASSQEQVAEAKKRVKGPRPVSRLLKPVKAGESAWVQVRWKTDVKVCDVEVTVWGNRDVEIDYPGDRDFTSFSRGDSLKAGHKDYTSFRVVADYDKDSWALLAATISYTDCKPESPARTKDTSLMLPVRA